MKYQSEIQWVPSSNIWATVMKKLNKSMFACSGFSNWKQITFCRLSAHWLLNSCNKLLGNAQTSVIEGLVRAEQGNNVLWSTEHFQDCPRFAFWLGVEQTSIFPSTPQSQSCESHGKNLNLWYRRSNPNLCSPTLFHLFCHQDRAV